MVRGEGREGGRHGCRRVLVACPCPSARHEGQHHRSSAADPPWAGCEDPSFPAGTAAPIRCHSPWPPCKLEAEGTLLSSGSGSAA